jgi:histidinol-phosphate/aromatic aminotransferase/cobyric acid decarboxylase-like protein
VTSAAPPAGEHGGDGARLAARLGRPAGDILDLSMSLNPCAPDVAALAAEHLDVLRRYPDDAAATAALATVTGVAAERLVLTNGGAEAIAVVAAELEEGWVDDPDFSLYARHLSKLAPGAGRWRSNPHNPSGRLAAPDEVAAVWDEAFWPLATGTWTRGDADRGAVVVGSLTKLFACPGLRAGYVLAPDVAFADRIRRRLPEWSLNGLACSLVPRLLGDADLPAMAAGTRVLQARLAEVLRGAGYAVESADGPWVLVPECGDLRERLARHGVLVRDCGSFGMAGTVRVGVTDEPGLTRLAAALRD